jgi:isocitrate dehydrogenase
MGAWRTESKTNVASMATGDFFGSEQSVTVQAEDVLRIEFVDTEGKTKILKDGIKVQAGEIVDAAVMSVGSLRTYLESEMVEAKKQGVLLSVHLKATMMKVSDPIIFGHVVSVYFKSVFEKYGQDLKSVGVNPNNGLGDLQEKIGLLPDSKRKEIQAMMDQVATERPALAMVNSDKGITNLHVPSDVIIDASMPALIRSSGQMWDAGGKLQDTRALIPDRCYAGIYQEAIQNCKQHGAFDPATMGSVANVGLMAQKAEEYGSHDKTFEIPAKGSVRVLNKAGQAVFSHPVDTGDIWRMCQTRDAAVRDWVKLAVRRAAATKTPALFWLDAKRGHDAQLIVKVKSYLPLHDTKGLDIRIQAPNEAIRTTMDLVRKGQDTISVTGNVLRDYLTDLFPILELGTSAKMLSIVPLLAGGGLFETGAGGSAPKHVEQFMEEGHLRWDSLGEFLAIAVSFEDLAEKTADPVQKSLIQTLAQALNDATGRILGENRSPGRKAGELDNRGSHFYLSLYWAEALARQSANPVLKKVFEPVAQSLRNNQDKILAELVGASGHAVSLGGYYHLDPKLAEAALRPSKTFNSAIAAIG